ncbi:hypothetical protein DUNSADRAFT_11593 [Dunaliella salina]|uniref:Secreted protein n=1 Tax=Dunaliella salina TaxID=3046 RepID=A0ABQ7GD02_DUNSA|nr:hypothetical protein DUNSADRAFT_11593 [Dunaliella salina]|eukprot:KAF5832493.1 hypothetical protein DUNSADRAFT_11593 [Dunaliella salina]
MHMCACACACVTRSCCLHSVLTEAAPKLHTHLRSAWQCSSMHGFAALSGWINIWSVVGHLPSACQSGWRNLPCLVLALGGTTRRLKW